MKTALKLAFVAMLIVFILRSPVKVNASTVCPYGTFDDCMSALNTQYISACQSECAEEYSPQYETAEYDACMTACGDPSSAQEDTFEQECIADGCIP